MSHADLRRVAEQVAFMHKGNLCMMHLSSWPMSNQSWPYPDFWPTNRPVEEGHLVMTNCRWDTACHQIMNTYFVGEPTPEYRRMFGWPPRFMNR